MDLNKSITVGIRKMLNTPDTLKSGTLAGSSMKRVCCVKSEKKNLSGLSKIDITLVFY
jgi:hypothetical protein